MNRSNALKLAWKLKFKSRSNCGCAIFISRRVCLDVLFFPPPFLPPVGDLSLGDLPLISFLLFSVVSNEFSPFVLHSMPPAAAFPGAGEGNVLG